MAPGTYNYTFQCMLPHGLPTSVEGEYGHIRYTARVVLDIPLWPDKEFEVPFTVIKGINLNAIPALRVIYLNFFCSMLSLSFFLSINSKVVEQILLFLFAIHLICRNRLFEKKTKHFSCAVCYAAVHRIQ